MAILTFKNKELDTLISARDLSSITTGLIYGDAAISPGDLSAMNTEPTYFYSSNEMIASLDGAIVTPDPPPRDEFTAFFEDLFIAGERRRTPPTGFRFSSPAKVRVNSFWNIAPTGDPGLYENYVMLDVDATIASASGDRISFRISSDDQNQVLSHFRSIGIEKPAYGLLLVVIEFENISSGEKFESGYLLKYTHAPLFSSAAIFEGFGGRDIVRDNLNKYTSPGYTSETFFVPTLSSSFVYNFYEKEEGDYDVYKVRNYKNEKLTDIPKYVKLTWDRPTFSVSEFEISNRSIVSIGIGANIEDSEFLAGSTRDALRSALSATARSSIIGDVGAGSIIGSRGTFGRFSGDARSAVINYFGHMVSIPSTTEDLAAAMAFAPRSRESSDRLGGTPRLSLPGGSDDAIEAEATVVDPSLIPPPPTEYTDLFASHSDYVGYVIEKERVSENGIDFELIDVIAVPNSLTTDYIDTKIAYGEIYRYKIRSIFRFVNHFDLPMYGDSDGALTKRQTVDYVDTNFIIRNRKTFYFDSPDSSPSEVTIEESVRPDPPSSVQLFANSLDEKIFITWSQKSQNRDVVGFNVYRRRLGDSRFSKLNSDLIAPRNNFYIDIDLIKDVDYLYAIEAADVHGNFSKLSNQFFIRIKEIVNFDNFQCESKQTLFKIEGAEVGDASPDKDKDELILIKDLLKINVNPLFKNTDENNTFLIRVTSLDTGIKKEFKINFRTQTIYHVSPYVPTPRPFWEVIETFNTERSRTGFLEGIDEIRHRFGR